MLSLSEFTRQSYNTTTYVPVYYRENHDRPVELKILLNQPFFVSIRDMIPNTGQLPLLLFRPDFSEGAAYGNMLRGIRYTYYLGTRKPKHGRGEGYWPEFRK